MKKYIIFIPLLFIIVGFLSPKVFILLEKRRYYGFSQALWLQKKSSKQYRDRYYMAQFLLDQDRLRGKTQSEIYDFLGRPEWAGGGNSNFRYNLGPRRDMLLPLGSEVWLTFKRNEAGDITKIVILPD